MASTKVQLVNPALIAWARKTAGLTAGQLATSLHKREEDILSWEEGRDAPTYRELTDLAHQVRRPLAAFFLPSVPETPALPVDFRTMTDREEGEYDRRSLLAFREARNWLRESRQLLDALKIRLSFSLPKYDAHGRVDEIASDLRSLLGVSFGEQVGWPCDDRRVCDMWRDVLFDRGVLTLFFRMPLRDVRAFSMLDHGLGLVGLNTADKRYGRVFSLFHDVAHLCLRKPGVSTDIGSLSAGVSGPTLSLERYCEAFAGAFLLPSDSPILASSLTAVARDPSRDSVIPIANRLKVSKYALLMRARELRYLTDSVFRQVYAEWREDDGKAPAKSDGGNHINNRVSHIGKRLVGLVFQALDAGQISKYDTSKLLGLNPSRFQEARERVVSGAQYVD